MMNMGDNPIMCPGKIDVSHETGKRLDALLGFSLVKFLAIYAMATTGNK